jgi:hypothetical protein
VRDPTVRFTIREKDLQALVALAEKNNQSVARVLRDLVRNATREGRKAETPTNDNTPQQ